MQELVDCGTITAEEAEHHPQKNIITRALGVDYRLDPEFTSVPVQRGDMLLLCTDGLTNVLPKEKIEEIFTKAGSTISPTGWWTPPTRAAAPTTSPRCCWAWSRWR